MRTVAGYFGHQQEPELKNSPHVDLVSNSRVGLEIELEGMTTPPQVLRDTQGLGKWWSVVEDGSLRGGNGTYTGEFVFNAPMFGADVVDALVNLENAIVGADTIPKLSRRCSVHVHLDVRDMTLQQVQKMVVLYVLCEEIFFSVAGEHRKSNFYSYPLTKLQGYMGRIRHLFMHGGLEHFTSTLSGNDKYSALNLWCMRTFGSIEFRHHEGEYRAEPLKRWVNLILALKSAVMSVDAGQLKGFLSLEHVNSLVNTGSLPDFIFEVFGSELLEGIDIVEALETSAYQAKALIAGVDEGITYPKFEFNSGSLRNPAINFLLNRKVLWHSHSMSHVEEIIDNLYGVHSMDKIGRIRKERKKPTKKGQATIKKFLVELGERVGKKSKRERTVSHWTTSSATTATLQEHFSGTEIMSDSPQPERVRPSLAEQVRSYRSFRRLLDNID